MAGGEGCKCGLRGGRSWGGVHSGGEGGMVHLLDGGGEVGIELMLGWARRVRGVGGGGRLIRG